MKAVKLLTLAAASGLIVACSAAKDVTQCTVAPMSDWQDQAQFQSELLDQGYEINEFKVTEGNCYEIYGTDPDGAKVEIYFNPVDGEVIKREEH